MSHLTAKEQRKSLHFAVLTISDSRKMANDKSGQIIRRKLEDANHHIVAYEICVDDQTEIASIIRQWTADKSIQAIVTTGGTGIGFRDVTVETVTPFFTKTIDGFGELFRFLSYTEDVGSKALLSRAVAGAINEQVLFALPGSSKAVELAMDKLILLEANHIVYELTKHLEG